MAVPLAASHQLPATPPACRFPRYHPRMRPRVLITDIAWPNLDIERGVLAEIDAELIVAATGSEANHRPYAGIGRGRPVSLRRDSLSLAVGGKGWG